MNWYKIFLVLQREYMTRVKSKAFIITTALMPIFMVILVGLPIVISHFDQDQKEKTILVKDQTGLILERLLAENPELYKDAGTTPEAVLQDSLLHNKINGFVIFDVGHIEDNKNVSVVTDGSGGITFSSEIKGQIRNAVYQQKLENADLTPEVRAILDVKPRVEVTKLSESGESKDDSTSLFILGYILAFAIYMALLIYGSIIMRSVIEEKNNRIVEVIASSVKPFELMLGKVLGVGLVGLTQFTIWIVGSALITTFLTPLILSLLGDPQSTANAQQAMAQAESAGLGIPSIGPGLIIMFLANFLLGYLLYSSLFAAIGSAAESETDTQQLSLPVMLPVIISIIIMPMVTSNPDSTLAVVTSLIPFLTPILMTARIAVIDVPIWQIALSYVLMIGTFYLSILLAGKIYRVGILMYGKKIKFSEIIKWVRYR